MAALAAPMTTVRIDLGEVSIGAIGNTLGCTAEACPDRVILDHYNALIEIQPGTFYIYPQTRFVVGNTGPGSVGSTVYLTFDRQIQGSLGGLPWQTGTLMQNGLVNIGTFAQGDLLGFNNGPTVSLDFGVRGILRAQAFGGATPRLGLGTWTSFGLPYVEMLWYGAQSPTANAGANVHVYQGEYFTLDGSGFAPAGDALSYNWLFSNGASYSGANPLIDTSTWGIGTFSGTLTVTDTWGFQGTSELSVQVDSPEPGTWLLALGGIVAVVSRRWARSPRAS